MNINRQSVMEVSKTNFIYNIEQIKKYVGNIKVMPVIKANGYGTYINKCLELIENFDIVAVACVSEGIELREIGYKGDIFVLNQPYLEDIENIVNYNIVVGVADINFIKEIGKRKDKFRVHLELETGMGRTGVYYDDLDYVMEEIKKYSNISLEGVYTHFSVADSDIDYTNKQIDVFEKSVNKIKNMFGTIRYVHCSASNGLLNFKVDTCNMVRSGIIMYGYPSSNNILSKISLKPIAKLKSKISFIKEIDEGVSISYGRTFISNNKMKIATVGIGYADGIRRSLSNKGHVVINGIKCKIVGTVCMDSFMVDISDLCDVKVGDTVYLWDNDLVTLEDVADICDTINYEVLSTISERVPRVFVD